MPLYDFECQECGKWEEHVTNSETVTVQCECGGQSRKIPTIGGVKRNDAPWIKNINGIANDLEHAQSGKVPYISTREEARAHIKEMYSDPHPAVRQLRQEYLERY